MSREVVAQKTMAAVKAFSSSKRKVGTARLLVDSLKGTSMTLVGDDTALLHETAKLVGARLGWFPVDVAKVVCGMNKVEALSELNAQQIAATEAEVLRGLRTQVRVIAATLAGGAASRQGTWQDLFGNVVILVDEEDRMRPKPRSAERTMLEANADLVVRIKPLKGFAAKGGNSIQERARVAAEPLLTQLNDKLVEDPGLVERKQQYRERGFRGDWPAVQAAGWSPVAQQLARPPLQGFEGAAGAGAGAGPAAV